MKQRKVFVCSSCGNETYNWSGKCPSCGEWNTLKEISIEQKTKHSGTYKDATRKRAKNLSELSGESEERFDTGISEFDRVLGGGAVIGSVVLVGGAPGIGKSTLLLQICGFLGKKLRVLYISGEESELQIKMRADRLKIDGEFLLVLTETCIETIEESIDNIQPDVVIIDSIQTMYSGDIPSTPGSIAQVRECTLKLMRKTKSANITAFIVGHINKDGNIAGPKVLEHMVDCVLYFEGERNTSFRILRAVKNRFGSTNEIGIFEMRETGLECVNNPSEFLLSGRPINASGTCIACVMEGTRPLLADIQSLVTTSGYNSASRRTNGIDYNRAAMLLAVLEKRAGIAISKCDVYINVIGGIYLDEPAADLSIALSIESSYIDKCIPPDVACIGEIGLTGEIRNVRFINQRLSELSRLGFTKCIIPYCSAKDLIVPEGLTIVKVENLQEAIRAVFHI